MKCPYCNDELYILDELCVGNPTDSLILRQISGCCCKCNRNFDWEEKYIYERIQDFREIDGQGNIIKEFESE